LIYGSSPVTVGQFGAWTFIGAEQITGGYEVALHLPGADQYVVWNTDMNGSVNANASGGIVAGLSNVLQSLEPSFQQDLNGDGTIGVHAAKLIAGLASGDNFVFRTDLLATGADITTGSREAGVEIYWIASPGQVEAPGSGEAATWFAPAAADGFSEDHLASLKFGHFILH
jgi:hypothetical protein